MQAIIMAWESERRTASDQTSANHPEMVTKAVARLGAAVIQSMNELR